MGGKIVNRKSVTDSYMPTLSKKKTPRNSPRTPRIRLCLPRSSKNVKLPFLDSSIPRGVKFSEELPFLQWCEKGQLI